jgi:hypothetical protein
MEGIEESKQIIAFIQVLAETIREAKEDGNIDIFDAVKALKLVPIFNAAVSNSCKIQLELSDLTGEEQDVLINDLKDAMFSLIEALI